MVAKITIPSNIRKALNYNEQKVKESKAECIYACNFLKEAEHLNFYEKLDRFHQLISLNKRATTNTVHISLNFAENEKIEREKLIEIASAYMGKIGFAQQPYLVYQHSDAGHPHIHIISTNIEKNGKRISLHNLGKNQSAKARKEIEIMYNLIKAEDQKQKHIETIKPVFEQKITYGKTPSKRSITNVLDAVLPVYRYSSLPELNAILKLYNVIADRGKENGIIYNKKGLVYRILDEHGNKIGVPIKASSIYNKPSLSYLEKKFKENELIKQQYKKSMKATLDWILMKQYKNLDAFKEALEKEKIYLIVRQNDNGIVYGLTYIDHRNKCIFNGSEIGKSYSAKLILEKCGASQLKNEKEKSIKSKDANVNEHTINISLKQYKPPLNLINIFNEITSPTIQYDYMPYEIKRRKKKKRKNN
jgi:hypothetical protein